MRPVRGFDRPLLQWMFIGVSVLLVAIAAFEAVALRRERAQREALHAANLEGRLDRQQLEMQLAREKSAREALSLEVARLRTPGDLMPPAPTLTLTPMTAPSATPPVPTVDQPVPDELIALRLALPAEVEPGGRFTISLRSWSGGPVLWMRGNLPATRVDRVGMVTATISGDVLVPGAYELILTAEGAQVASYQVTVGGGR